VIPGDGVPRSLGVINRGGETAITLPAALRTVTAAGATLAVSLEPAGGSPTGKPTGPVIAAGKINKI
jgi:anti-sigma-K factor RskA